MKIQRFKTTIKCAGCVATATPVLNAVLGENNWKVDTTDPAKILTLHVAADEQKVIEAIQKAGFKAEKL